MPPPKHSKYRTSRRQRPIRASKSGTLPYQFKNILSLLFLLLLIFLFVGPYIPISGIQSASLEVQAEISTIFQEKIIAPIQQKLSQIQITNPLQTAFDRRYDEYTQAVEAVTGEKQSADDTCIALFGLIPLNCPDPFGDGVITADRPGDVSTDECVELFGLTPLQCRQNAR